jgi:hypothetical protein
MTERLTNLSDDRMAVALADLGRHLAYPSVDVTEAVTERMHMPVPRARVIEFPRSRSLRRASLAAVAAVLLLGAAAAAGRLGVPGLRIVFGPSEGPVHAPVGRNLFLGHATTLEQARDRVPFAVYVPHGRHLGPGSVYIGSAPPGGRVSLVYPPRPGLPVSRFTHAGLMITEFQARIDFDFVKKLSLQGTRVDAVTVNGFDGVWFAGAPHEVQYLDRNGIPFQDSTRLAGNTLVWSEGLVTIRLECDCSKATALRIAESIG